MAAFDKLFTMCGRGFQGLNQALLRLETTSEAPKHGCFRDYRPISLIHIFANWWQRLWHQGWPPKLESLVDRNQCTFIRQHCIHDNLMLVQQTARLVHKVMLKLDIVRAFDSVSWGLLFEVLCKLGFGPRFCDWVAILLSTANSQWQANPLSPMLFMLVINTLNRLLSKATELGVVRRLARREITTTILLYANDVVIFCHPGEPKLHVVCSILKLFRHTSGYTLTLPSTRCPSSHVLRRWLSRRL
jgi:hypothetical protein